MIADTSGKKLLCWHICGLSTPLWPCLPQVKNFSDLSGLAGLSLGTILLATLGNALCIPRALATRDPSWSFGCTWGCLAMGWAQLLCLALGRSPETGCADGWGVGLGKRSQWPPWGLQTEKQVALVCERHASQPSVPHKAAASPPAPAAPCSRLRPPIRTPNPCSAHFLPPPAFAAVSAALAAYLAWVMTSDARAKGLANALGSYADVFGGGRKPAPPREFDP
jgi:hypothetical protein